MSTARRDQLIAIERKVQAEWADAKVFERDAPAADEAKAREKFFVTFPYPYTNGVLHLGHAFSMTKAEFTARYQRLLGKEVLFPFAFHTTGMPIAACADKLRNEIAEYGNPPQFPAPEDGDDDADKQKKSKGKGKIAKKKSRLRFQWEIMREMGIPEEDIAQFADARAWLSYFPPIARKHLDQFGLAADFRRAFITTDVNPYYDRFIQWQFNTLKRRGVIDFGKRCSVFSPLTQQPCADHDRASGEGVNPQEYTLIKLRLLEPFPEPLAEFKDRTVILPAATLRPETMYGQTNCFVLPSGEYGVYEVKGGDVFVCSDRSALNMSYQDMMPGGEAAFGKPVKLATVRGEALLGCAVSAPLAQYERVYVLPLLSIKMNKGTGVVTSVPSDAPDDYAALQDLKKKKAFREKFGLTDEMVLPFEVVEIIEIPGLGRKAAADLCEARKVQSQNDRVKLDKIKEEVYKKGFYAGKMIVGPHAGTPIERAKDIIRKEMIERGEALTYSEPESVVMSRSGDECVVALVDQWYLKYGEDSPEWKGRVEKHVNEVLETYNPVAKKAFQEVVAWLREWACSRSYGLGSRVPFDKRFLIESLSDSTIYMSYYTIAHLLQGGVLDGSETGPAGIPAEKLTDDVFEYVFVRGTAYPSECGIAQETLDRLRHEFEFWYPVDMRVSGKDLIRNHLTMCLYNHAAIWETRPELWPRSFFTNGHLNINGEKMSKSTGNFKTLVQALEEFSTDATRVGLADAGDGLDDANFDEKSVNGAILRLTKEEAWIDEIWAQLDKLPTGDWGYEERVFDNDMRRLVAAAKASYDAVQFHEVLRAALYDFSTARDQYRLAVGQENMNADLVRTWLERFIVMCSPIIPHWTQHIWRKIGKPGFIVDASFPTAEPEDATLTMQVAYIRMLKTQFQAGFAKIREPKKKKKKQQKKKDEAEEEAAVELPDCLLIVVARGFQEWQQVVIDFMRDEFKASGACPPQGKVLGELKKKGLVQRKKDQGAAMKFATEIKEEAEKAGEAAFERKLPFDEIEFVTANRHLIIAGIQELAPERVVVLDDGHPAAAEICTASGKACEPVPGAPIGAFFLAKDAPEAVAAIPSQQEQEEQ